MRTVGTRVRMIVAGLLILLPVLGVTSVSAQEQAFTPGAYTSSLSGYEIDVSGPAFEISEATLEHYANGEGEVVTIDSELSSVEVSFFDDDDSPDVSIDAYLSSMETSVDDYSIVDRGEMADHTYALAAVKYEGVDLLYYVQVTEDVVGNVDLFEAILVAEIFLEDAFASAQEEILIEGASFMANVDAADIMLVLEEGGSLSGSDATSESSTLANTVTFDIADADLDVGGDFVLQGDIRDSGEIQSVTLIGKDSISVVAVGETGLDAESTLLEFQGGLTSIYASIENIDSETDGDIAWSLHKVELQDGTFRTLLIVADTSLVPGFEMLQAHEMPEDSVAETIIAIQIDLTLNGEPLLSQFNADEIASNAAGDGIGEVIDPTADATVDETPEATSGLGTERSDNPREGAKLPGSSGSGAGNTSEVNRTPVATEEVDTGSATVSTSATSWEGPILGHLVEWDAAVWLLDEENPDSTIADEGEQYDGIVLSADSSLTSSFLYVDVFGDSQFTADDYLDFWLSEEFLNRTTSSGDDWNAEVLGSRSRGGSVSVVLAYSTSDGDFVMIREATLLDDGSMLIVTVDASADDIELAYSQAHEGITIDTNALFVVFTPAQIERLMAE